MTSPKAARRQHSVIIDSDDDAEIYDYRTRLSEQHGEVENATRRKSYGEDAANGEKEQANTPETDETSSDELALGDEARHPFYNYATEKFDTHADAKLIYQRHRMDTKSETEPGSPLWLQKTATLPSLAQGEGAMLGRTASISSKTSKAGGRGSATSHIEHVRSRDPFPTLEAHVNEIHQNTDLDPYLNADAAARDHRNHPGLPHEFKDPLLASQGVHGAGAGVGMGHGADGFAKDEGSIVSEVGAICEKIKTVLDLRCRFLSASLQRPGDNPKDDEEWNIYPPPPKQVWAEDKSRLSHPDQQGLLSESSSIYMTGGKTQARDWGSYVSIAGSDVPTSPTARKQRKAGLDIGADFELSECDIPGKEAHGLHFAFNAESVYQVFDKTMDEPIADVPGLREYYIAMDMIGDIASDGPAKSFAYRRLQYLEGRYNLYTLLNEYEEVADTKKVPHRDFYNVRKVDTHVHHSACMNQKHLLRFIKSKMKKCPEEVVIDRDGKRLTLREVFESINLTAYDLSIDTLDMHAHTDSFHRFDKFNLKYNPIGQSRLRDIFLKTDNFIKGRYLADITREVISDLESSKYQMVEWRISIYGRNMSEWDKLAAWVVDNKLFSHNVRWLIQIPRLYALYKSTKTVNNFEEMIRNIFQPLFEVTQDPSSHPKLHIFLQRVIGFDSVDDESKIERRLYRKFPVPREWNTKQNPPYGYYVYFLYANMTSLNVWRKRRGFNTFLLRPHCGEAGDIDHLASAALCCHSISHGITLRKAPLLQYIFYLDQIGIAMSPLSNNALFLTYDRNPFISYFKKGMNVSLSTDDPLQFAFTKEPLIEEYSVAAQIYKLGSVDMCELAKHSVDQCGFELSLKQRWLGRYCYLPGVLGNDVAKCNVPDVREAFRHETLKAEHSFIAKYTPDYVHLERCTPSLPDALINSTTNDHLTNYNGDPNISSNLPSTKASSTYLAMNELYKALESPKQYYATVADSITPARTARLAAVASAPSFSAAARQPTSSAASSGPETSGKQATREAKPDSNEHVGRASPTRRRTASRTSTTLPPSSSDASISTLGAPAMSLPLSHSTTIAGAPVDLSHLSGAEPRAFPGVVHERERRRSLMLGSSSTGLLSQGLRREREREQQQQQGYTDPDQVPATEPQGREKLSRSVESVREEEGESEAESDGELGMDERDAEEVEVDSDYGEHPEEDSD